MLSIFLAAGWPAWFLLIASLITLAVIIERFLSLKQSKITPNNLLNEVLGLHRNRQLTAEVIQKLENNSPLGRVLATGLRYETASREVMKEAIEETGRAVGHDMERFLTTLGTIATVAPLLGLFGTVIGMIELFGLQSPGMATNPGDLAHGISVALYNTALGLAVAIPALIFYRYFRSRIDGFMVEMEQQALRLVDYVRSPTR